MSILSYRSHKCKYPEHSNIRHVSVGHIKVGGSGSAEGPSFVCGLEAHGEGGVVGWGLEDLFFKVSGNDHYVV